MSDYTLDQLARIGHGAIEVEESREHTPVKIFLAGPIKYWWSLPKDEWGKGAHAEYLQWRDAVEAALVISGALVYRPYSAWRGSWDMTGQAQEVNYKAISISDIVINLTPEGIPAEGTDDEVAYAERINKPVVNFPPRSAKGLDSLIEMLDKLFFGGENGK